MTQAWFRRWTFHEPNLIRIKADPNNLDRLNSLELIQTPIFKSSGTKFKGRKCSFRLNRLQDTL